MSILVITTGGTIGAMPVDDPRICPSIVTMPSDGKDLVRESLTHDFLSLTSRCVSLEPRDSKLFDDAYRNNLIKLVDEAPEKMVLITHGTDTILITAEYFFDKAKEDTALRNKAVILTGAMLPLANGHTSDGFLNLQFSLEQLAGNTISAGIYIVLCDYVDAEKRQGWAPRLYCFAPNKYEKFYNKEDARFSRICLKERH